jgi:hypothetical protein
MWCGFAPSSREKLTRQGGDSDQYFMEFCRALSAFVVLQRRHLANDNLCGVQLEQELGKALRSLDMERCGDCGR